MRWEARATGLLDDASAVLPPARDGSAGAGDALWQTASFAAITREPPTRGKLTIGLAVLCGALVAVGGYAGIQLAALGGLTPPSPPRYVVTEQAAVRPVVAPARRSVPRGARGDGRGRDWRVGASGSGLGPVRILRSH